MPLNGQAQGVSPGVRLAVVSVGLTALVALGALGLAMTRGVGQPPTGATDAGFEVAPDFTLARVEGGTFTLSDSADGPVFVYFWASWCLPCREEAPIIERLWSEYRARGYTFVGVNILDLEKDARAFANEFGLTFPLVRDEAGSVYLQYGVYGVPESFFLAPQLRVQAKFLGPLTEQALREQLDRSQQ